MKFDFTPDPKVLIALTHTPMQPLDALCELIDNSIDSFYVAKVQGVTIDNPMIIVTLPTRKQLSQNIGFLRIQDNGPGMTAENAEKAIKAGFSGNNPYDMYRPPKVRPKNLTIGGRFFMLKYNYEFKKKVVDAYNNGEGGYLFLAKKFGMPDTKDIRMWVANYNSFGDEGLRSSQKRKFYSFEKKLSVVKLYLSSEISYQDLALQEGIMSPSLITNWVNRFRAAGPDALRPRKKGRKKILNNPDNNTKNKPIEESIVDTSVEHVRELEDELLKLRIENAFLKEMRRLRLEDEAKMRERLESLTVSEDNSN